MAGPPAPDRRSGREDEPGWRRAGWSARATGRGVDAMHRRWLKIRKRLVRSLVPLVRLASPRAASRAMTALGWIEHALVPGARLRHDQAVTRWSNHFGGQWDVRAVSRELA